MINTNSTINTTMVIEIQGGGCDGFCVAWGEAGTDAGTVITSVGWPSTLDFNTAARAGASAVKKWYPVNASI